MCNSPNPLDLCITDNELHLARGCYHWNLKRLQVCPDFMKGRLQGVQPHAQVELVHPIIWSLIKQYKTC
jgi:hypothetical protein